MCGCGCHHQALGGCSSRSSVSRDKRTRRVLGTPGMQCFFVLRGRICTTLLPSLIVYSRGPGVRGLLSLGPAFAFRSVGFGLVWGLELLILFFFVPRVWIVQETNSPFRHCSPVYALCVMYGVKLMIGYLDFYEW